MNLQRQTDFWEAYFSLKVHPTLTAAISIMAEQILNALPERGTLPFADVPADAWYYDELYYAWFNTLIKGTSETTFSPAATTTRAQLVTVLYRMAGSPNVSGLTEPFTDVSDNHWARDAIIWAYESAFIKGYNATTFGPEDGLTRAQLVTILHRYAGSPDGKRRPRCVLRLCRHCIELPQCCPLGSGKRRSQRLQRRHLPPGYGYNPCSACGHPRKI